jgi:hypothetical protein
VVHVLPNLETFLCEIELPVILMMNAVQVKSVGRALAGSAANLAGQPIGSTFVHDQQYTRTKFCGFGSYPSARTRADGRL